jgi:rod shape-determining protein MreC
MSDLTRRLPWLTGVAVGLAFLTICFSIGLQKGGNLINIAEQAALTMAYPVQKGIDLAFTTCGEVFDRYINLIGTRDKNLRLEKEVAELNHRLAQLEETRLENQRLHKLLNFREQYDVLARGIAAHVIGRQTESLSRILIVDCGHTRGIRVNSPVFTPGGVIGRVVACGPQSAKVLLLTDRNSACDVIVQRNRARGILQGTGDRVCRLAYLRRTTKIQPGDQLITSGLDGIFPKGITVGSVIAVNHQANNLSQDIIVKPEFSADTIEEVYILPSSPTL